MSMPVISALDFTGANMVDESIPDDTPMKNFYRDKTIFLTGATGFLGQLFVEKLLRCRVKQIYVLARPKKDKTPAERIQETFVGPVFVKLKSIDPKYMHRIYLIEGDTCKSDLGISNDHRSEIIDNVEIVLHAAADVRFDVTLQELCFTNVRGTKALIALAEEMKHLILFAYVSTAFSQYHQKCIEEKFYPPPLDPDQMIRIADHFSQSKTDELLWLTDKLIEPWANTYVFTKSLAEELVRRAVSKIPIVIIRPSIIITTYEDPIPGWCNNVYGVNGMTVGCGLGFIKVSHCNPNNRTNVVCADFVTNGTLAAIWNKADEFRSGSTTLENIDERKVIHHITSDDNTALGIFVEELLKLYATYPVKKALWIPSVIFCKTKIAFFILTILYQLVPALFYDVFFKLTNNKLRLMPMYRKYLDFLVRVTYFTYNDWWFVNNNMKTIIEKMSKNDKMFFPCDISEFRLLEYCFTYILGLRTYIVKEPLDNIDAAKKRFLMLRIAKNFTLILYYCFLCYFIYLVLHFTGSTYFIKSIYDKL